MSDERINKLFMKKDLYFFVQMKNKNIIKLNIHIHINYYYIEYEFYINKYNIFNRERRTNI